MGKYDTKPDEVDLPDGKDWQSLSYEMKVYYGNREGRKIRSKNRKDKIRIWFNKYKSTLSCESCGEGHPATLDFHHKNADDKHMGLARMVTQGYSKKSIKEEVSKCEVVCANCHRKEHYDPMLE